MKLIVLEGNSNTGKTTTLGMLYKDLLSKGATVSKNKTPLGGDPNDFECIVNYNGQKVAFYTMGDYSNYLSNAISHYDKQQSCDIFICALSTNPIITNANANNKINRYNNQRIPKTLASTNLTELQANQYDANIIFGMI